VVGGEVGSTGVNLEPTEVVAQSVVEMGDLESVDVDIPGQTFADYEPTTVPGRRERVRETLSFIFAGIFGGVILLPIVLVLIVASLSPLSLNDVWLIIKEWLQIILPPVTGILGASVGFYFGTRDNNSG